ncbi:MAG: hypothetical protein QXU98_06465 [Candidatus Parvarchaeota archaeon]
MKTRIVNPDELDIASNVGVWWSRFFRGYNHVSYAALITAGIGIYQVITSYSLSGRIIGAVLLLLGGTIFVDMYSHLFTA